MSEHGLCKKCGVDFDGGDIVQTFLAQGKSPEEAAKIADLYGYGPGRTQWGRQIYITDFHLDRNVQVVCPDCNAEQWDK